MSTPDELACTYAALMLADDGVTITVSIYFLIIAVFTLTPLAIRLLR